MANFEGLISNLVLGLGRNNVQRLKYDACYASHSFLSFNPNWRWTEKVLVFEMPLRVWPHRKRLHADKSIFFSFKVLMGGNEVLPYTQRSFSSPKKCIRLCAYCLCIFDRMLACPNLFHAERKKRLASCGCWFLAWDFHHFHRVHSTPCGTIWFVLSKLRITGKLRSGFSTMNNNLLEEWYFCWKIVSLYL